MCNKFHSIRQFGNDAVHNQKGNIEIALIHLEYAHELGVWYFKKFYIKSNFIPRKFKLPDEYPDQAIDERKQTDSEFIQREELEKLCQEQQARLEEMQQNIARIQTEAQTRLKEMQQNSTEQIQETINLSITEESLIPVSEDVAPTNTPFGGYEKTRDVLGKTELSLQQIAILIGELQLEPIVIDAQSILPGLGMVSDASILSKYAEDIHQGVFKLIVIGEFNHGKSTLLNAMMGSKTLPAKCVLQHL